jgi:hypothetical protein
MLKRPHLNPPLRGEEKSGESLRGEELVLDHIRGAEIKAIKSF